MLALALFFLLGSAVASHATDYYVQLSPGSPASTCAQAQNIGTPHDTILEGLNCLEPGDTLYLRSGTYADRISVISGTVNGTAVQRITIAGYPGETVTIQPNTLVSPTQTTSATNYITFRNLIFDGANTGVGTIGTTRGIRIDNSIGIIFEDVEIKNMWGNGITIAGASNAVIRRAKIHDMRTDCIPGNRWYGIYYHHGAQVEVVGSEIYNNPGGGAQFYPGPLSSSILHHSVIRNNATTCANDVHIGGLIVGTDSSGGNISGISVYSNLVYSNGAGGAGGNGHGIRVQGTGGGGFTNTGTKIYNNTIINNVGNTSAAYGIWVSGVGVVDAELRNNFLFGNEAGSITITGHNGGALPTNTIMSHNAAPTAHSVGTSKVNLSAITDCLASGSDFTLKAGTNPCIDAGIDVGRIYNGSAPDIGAFETFIFASCQVPNGSANTIEITFISNANLLGDTLTTFTARRNGSTNALTGAASKIGDTIISIPLTATYVGGDTADISWSSGGLTDNAKVGNLVNQPFLQTLTNQSCTNNAGSAPAHVLTQQWVQYRGVVGPESTTDIRSDNTVQYPVQNGGAARFRTVVTCTIANCPPTAFLLRYSRNSGPDTVVPDVYGADNIAACGNRIVNIGVENATPTTNQITGVSGTFIPGAVILSSNAIPTVSGLNVGYKTEMEHCVSFDTDASGSYAFKLYDQNGSQLTYFQIADILIVPPRAPTGF